MLPCPPNKMNRSAFLIDRGIRSFYRCLSDERADVKRRAQSRKWRLQFKASFQASINGGMKIVTRRQRAEVRRLLKSITTALITRAGRFAGDVYERRSPCTESHMTQELRSKIISLMNESSVTRKHSPITARADTGAKGFGIERTLNFRAAMPATRSFSPMICKEK